jgi:hypothetical protein
MLGPARTVKRVCCFRSPVRSRFEQGPSRLTPRAPRLFLPSNLLVSSLIPFVTRHRAVQVPGILAPVPTLVQTRTASMSARFPLSSSVLRKGLLLPPGFYPYATRALNSIISCTHRFRLGLVPQVTQGLQPSAQGSTTASPASLPSSTFKNSSAALSPPPGFK